MEEDDTGSHIEDEREVERVSPKPLTSSEKFNLREEGRRVLQSLDESQRQNLSLHLYSAFLLHQHPRPKVQVDESGNEVYSFSAADQTHPKFPGSRWTDWPMTTAIDQKKAKEIYEIDVFDHKAPVPKAKEIYTDPTEPNKYPVGIHKTPEYLQTRYTEREYSIFPSPEMLNSIDNLYHEFNAVFQHSVYQQLYRREKEPRVDPEPKLPPQTCKKVFDMLDQIFDRVGKERGRTQENMSRLNPYTWADVLTQDIMVGKTAERCRRLFMENNDKGEIPDDIPMRQFKLLGVSQSHGRPSQLSAKSHKSIAKESRMSSRVRKISNHELLQPLTANFTCKPPPEFAITNKRIKKVQKSVSKRLKNDFASVTVLDILDRKIYKAAKERGFLDTKPPAEEDFIVANNNQSYTRSEKEKGKSPVSHPGVFDETQNDQSVDIVDDDSDEYLTANESVQQSQHNTPGKRSSQLYNDSPTQVDSSPPVSTRRTSEADRIAIESLLSLRDANNPYTI